MADRRRSHSKWAFLADVPEHRATDKQCHGDGVALRGHRDPFIPPTDLALYLGGSRSTESTPGKDAGRT